MVDLITALLQKKPADRPSIKEILIESSFLYESLLNLNEKYKFFNSEDSELSHRIEENGDTYFGSVKNGVRHGKGKLIFANITDHFRSVQYTGVFE